MKGCIHRCMYLWQQHASRCKGRCTEGCRVSAGLVRVVVLTLKNIFSSTSTSAQHGGTAGLIARTSAASSSAAPRRTATALRLPTYGPETAGARHLTQRGRTQQPVARWRKRKEEVSNLS